MDSTELAAMLKAFVDARNWAQFHTPENLAKSISIEAAELLECFQWSSNADEARIREELADVLIYAHLLADKIGASPEALILQKLAVNEAKYPVEKSFGKSVKYDQL